MTRRCKGTIFRCDNEAEHEGKACLGNGREKKKGREKREGKGNEKVEESPKTTRTEGTYIY